MRDSIKEKLQPSALKIIRDFQQVPGRKIGHLLKPFGIALVERTMPATVSGRLTYDPSAGSASGYCIIVNANHPAERKRFTVAHELGHYLLHRLPEVFPAIFETERSGVAFYTEDDKIEEGEANAFAAEVLLPMGLFEVEYFKDTKDWSRLMSLFWVSRSTLSKRVDEVWRRRL